MASTQDKEKRQGHKEDPLEEERRSKRSRKPSRRKRKERDPPSEECSSSGSSDSSLYDSSSSEEEESKGRTRRMKKKRKKKKRSRREKRQDKKHKKSKKSKKHKKDKKHKKSKEDHKGPITTWGKYGIVQESDMWSKDQEFKAYLRDVKKVHPEMLSNRDTKEYWKDFMEDFNTATMPSKKYYDLPRWEAREMKRKRKLQRKAARRAMKKGKGDYGDEGISPVARDEEILRVQRRKEAEARQAQRDNIAIAAARARLAEMTPEERLRTLREAKGNQQYKQVLNTE